MTSSVHVDAYVIDTLLRDLVGHDRAPSAFLVYLFLWRRTLGADEEWVQLSHRALADETGLSKSAVQGAVRTLSRRKLLRIQRATATAIPRYTVLRPWRKTRKS